MRAVAFLVAIGFATSLLSGCAGQGAAQLPVDPSDPCGQDRAALAQSRTYFTDQIVTGAVTGGAIGAIGGALIGAATGGGRGAAIGALAGGATGALVGGSAAYYNTMQERYQDTATLARGINADLQRESAEMDHVNASFARLRECRFSVAQRIKYEVRTGRMSRDAAVSALAFQRGMFAQEIQVARSYGVNMAKRDEQFATAANQLQQQGGYTPPSTGGRSTRYHHPAPTLTQQVVTNATESIPEKRTAFVDSVDQAEQRSKVAFNLDAAGTGGAS